MAIITKALTIDSNYMTLRNTGSDAIVINKITPPTWIWEGFQLILEFDNLNKGDGIFLKNKVLSDSAGNLRLSAEYNAAGEGYGALLSTTSINSGTSANKNAVGHIMDALKAIRDADNTARNNAITAADAAAGGIGTILQTIRTGAFAYGVGGATFVHGWNGQVISGVTYYDYSSRHPIVVLIWNGAEWQQESLQINAVS